jgi:hypothetical protein
MTDMLKLLKIIDKVEKPVMLNEAVSLNISANGDSPDDITAILGKLVNLSNPSSSTQDMTPHGGHKDMMMKTIADVDGYADGAAHEYADEMGEEYANEPDPEISDVEYMTKDLAGGLNKPKKQFKKEYPGDNPMTMEEARAAQLMAEYKSLLEGNPINKAKKDAAVSAIGSKNREKHYLTRMNPNQADKIRGREVTQGKDRKWHGTDNQDRMDELSPKTLGSYINKSAASLGKAGYKAGSTDGTADKLDPHIHTINKRTTGIKRATDRLTREEQIEDEGLGRAAWALTKGAVKVPAKAVGNLAGGAAKGALRGAGSLGKGLVKGVAKAAPAVIKGVGGAVGNVAMGAARGIGRAGSGMAKDIKQVGRDVKTAYRKEATDPRDSRPETWRSNNTGYAWDKLSTRSSSNPKDSKATKSGKQLGLKHSIKGALGSHGPKGHLPEEQISELSPKTLGSYVNKSAASLGKAGYKAGSTDGTAAKLDPHIHTINKRTTGIKRATDRLTRESTDKKPTDDAKKKKSEKMKAYRADRDKHGED